MWHVAGSINTRLLLDFVGDAIQGGRHLSKAE